MHPFDLDPLHEARLKGFAEGWAARQAEIDQANADADRYYRAAYNPNPVIKLGKSHAELETIRAEIYGGAL